MVKFIKKYKLIMTIFLISIVTIIAAIITNDSYATTVTKTFTREQLQEYIVSTAISYYRNQNYSDYDQHAMDSTFSYNGLTIDTFMWRDFNITPESPSRTNNYHNDCSSFIIQTLMNSINYDFSNYYNYSANSSYLFQNFSFNQAKSSSSYFKQSYQKVAKGPSTYMMNNFAATISGATSGVEYTNNSSVINYYYKISGNETTTKKQTVINNIKSRLQPGDIIVYRQKDSSGSSGGHVVIYAKDFITNEKTQMTGFIHSTGVSYNFTDLLLNRDKYSVRTATMTEKIDDIVFSNINNGDSKTTTSYMILRPINYYCGSGSSCNLTINTNVLGRNELKNLKIEQYTSSEQKDISKYNTININDELNYNLEIKNIKDTSNNNLIITNKVPTNTEFISCDNNCNYDNTTKKVTWNIPNISLLSTNTYSYKVKVLSESEIINEGMLLTTKNNNTLQMAELKTKINPTLNDILSQTKLDNTINSIIALHQNNYLKYGTSPTTTSYKTKITDVNSNNNLTISALDFIKFVYYNTYNIDLTTTFNKEDIKSSLFTYNNSYDSYTKKTTTSDDISKMLVPGLYGGRLLRGNDNNDRTKFMTYKDLEVGDIIISYITNATLITSYIYTGIDESKNPIFIRLSSSNEIEILTSTNAINFLNEIYSKSLFAILRPSKTYALTVNFEYDNATKQGIQRLITSKTSTYENLPTSEKKYTVTYNYNAQVANTYPINDIVTHTFDGWYNEDKTKKVTNESNMLQTTSHTLYAKYTNNSITLPNPINDGYIFDGWYEDNSYQTKLGNGGSNYTPTENITLYAKWKAEEPEEFNITSQTLTITEEYINLTENYRDFTTYLQQLEYNNSFNYQLKLYNQLDYQITNNIVSTGSKLKIVDNNTLIKEYINIVKGDVNQTGTVTMADVMKMVNYLLDKKTMIEEYNLKAADVTNNNSIGMNDVMKIVNYLLIGGNL